MIIPEGATAYVAPSLFCLNKLYLIQINILTLSTKHRISHYIAIVYHCYKNY